MRRRKMRFCWGTFEIADFVLLIGDARPALGNDLTALFSNDDAAVGAKPPDPKI